MEIERDRKAVITGAASGIGLEVARRLLSEGASVALLDVNEQRLGAIAAELGENALATPADVRSAADVHRAIEIARTAFGGLDTLVACAGVVHVRQLDAITEDDWDRTLDINLKGTFLCCQAAAPALSASGRGRIVTISSDAGRRGVPQLLAYSASKFGVIGLTESLAAELAPRVTVNSVCPVGVPTTGMGAEMLSWKVSHTGRSAGDVLAGVAHSIPLGRNATEHDVANAVLFFISSAASFITGVALDVDGGSHLNSLPGVNGQQSADSSSTN